MSSLTVKKARLIVRNATFNDIPDVIALSSRVYPNMPIYTKKIIKNHISVFPDGQFVAIFDGHIIGYSSSIRILGETALQPHTWDEITNEGSGSTHHPCGDYLYGMEIFVDEKYRDHHIGQRIYNIRKKLCIRLRLKGIITGGRLPHLAETIAEAQTPEHYVEMVQTGKIKDHTLLFQLRNGFQVIRVLKDYIPEDNESLGYATHLIWYNPEIATSCDMQKTTQHQYQHKHHHVDLDHVRVATVQYEQRQIYSFKEFSTHVEYFVKVVAEYHADFVLFPESFTMQLLSIHQNEALSPEQAIAKLATYTDDFKTMMTDFALHYNINIIGGSTVTKTGDHMQNVSYIFLRDGSVHAQGKIHPTPDERQVWQMQGASKLDIIETDCGPIGVLICYDSEFPELTRHLIDQGMYILFVPFCTDQRTGYLRVRYCAQARAVENQCYVAIAGNVGNLPGVRNMNVQYAQSCILTPCDFPFARDGIAADSSPNVETISFADLNIKTLITARNVGSVVNLKDRRHDLYSVQWHDENQHEQ